jgi:uncharacterized protein
VKGRLAALLVLVVMIVVVHDVANEPRYSWSAGATIGAIDSYRSHVSPHLRGYVRCRFTPTCSAYGREAIRKYGFAVGGWRAVKRIARCGPWTKMGTVDPP